MSVTETVKAFRAILTGADTRQESIERFKDSLALLSLGHSIACAALNEECACGLKAALMEERPTGQEYYLASVADIPVRKLVEMLKSMSVAEQINYYMEHGMEMRSKPYRQVEEENPKPLTEERVREIFREEIAKFAEAAEVSARDKAASGDLDNPEDTIWGCISELFGGMK